MTGHRWWWCWLYYSFLLQNFLVSWRGGSLRCPLAAQALSSPSEVMSNARHVWGHLRKESLSLSTTSKTKTVQDLANVKIPRRNEEDGIVLAYYAEPQEGNDDPQKQQPPPKSPRPILLLIHEFFGLSESICDKAQALANDLQCTVIAPDTFRGVSSTFIPLCIWLAISTPQERVNQDLNDVLAWAEQLQQQQQQQQQPSMSTKLAVMGFCYGGGKAIRYTTQEQPHAATVICYGSPVLNVSQLSKLQAPVCGIFGADDIQFPIPQIEAFQDALAEGDVGADIRIFDDVGHAFWKDMEQIQRKDQPQTDAYLQITSFLSMHFS